MRKLLVALILILAGARYSHAQGILVNLTPPAPNAIVRVCPSPDNGYPCPTLQTIYSDSGDTTPITQPVSLGSGGFFSFYVPAGTYTIQLSGPGYGSGNRQVINVGGSGGGGGTPCTTTALSLQYNDAGAFGCVPDLTFDGTHTITLGPSGIFVITGALNLSGATVTWPGTVVLTNQANAYSTGAQDFSSATSLKLPIGASLAPTTEALVGWDTTNHRPVFGNGTNTTFPTWITTAPTTGHCPQFSGTLGLLVDSGSANCGGLANPMTTLGDVLYGGASGVPTRLAGPTVAGTYSLVSKPSGGAATALTFGLPGVVTNAQVGTTYTYQQTDSVNDRAGFTTFANASAIAVTLPSAASFGSNWTNLSCDQLAGTATITPGTSTIDSYNPTAGTYTAATTTLVLTTGQCAFIYSDNTNYHAVKFTSSAGGAAALSALTAAVGTNTLANGNNPQLWNWAQTTNTQAGMTFGETSAATAGTVTTNLANQANVAVSTAAASTATPLSVSQGSVNGTVSIPAMQISTTWNNSGLTGQGLVVKVTNTSSTGSSAILNLFNATTSELSVDPSGDINLNGQIFLGNGNHVQGANDSASWIAQGGRDGGDAGTTNGSLTVKGATNSATSTASGAGNLTLNGGDATGASGATIAGTALLRPGQATSASGLQGMIWFAESFFGGGTNTLWNLQCESAAMTVNDCGASPTTVIGIAANATSPIVTVTYGVSPVNASAAVTLGHTVCASSTAGKVTDSGGLTACTLGTEVGIVMAVSGTYNLPTGGTVVLSTTLPLIHMKVD